MILIVFNFSSYLYFKIGHQSVYSLYFCDVLWKSILNYEFNFQLVNTQNWLSSFHMNLTERL